MKPIDIRVIAAIGAELPTGDGNEDFCSHHSCPAKPLILRPPSRKKLATYPTQVSR